VGTSLGQAIRARRRNLGWSQEQLAEEASRLKDAPKIDVATVGYVERARTTVRLDDPLEPLPWMLKALGMEDGKAVLVALGLAA
jgi:transcriptional regulator with XRE-family HTH domain